jgi:hypothetical protein
MFASMLLAASLVAPSAPPAAPAPDVNDTVKKGLKWLCEQQTKEGFWAGRGDAFKVQSTAYAGLALLMQGSTPKEGPHAENIRRAVAWMESIQGANGMLGIPEERIESSQNLTTHALALLFLATAYDVDDDCPRRQKLAKLLQGGVEFAAESRTSRGAWGRVVTARGLGEFDETVTTATMLHSLLLIERAGLDVPKAVIEKATKYCMDATAADGGVAFSAAAGGPQGFGQPISSAVAATTLMTLPRRPGKLPGWVANAKRGLPNLPATMPINANSTNGFAMQQHLIFARVVHGLGDEGHRQLDPKAQESALLRWSPHREQLFKFLKTAQKDDGHWEDQSIGDTFSSAIALIMLQLDNNYIPAFSR